MTLIQTETSFKIMENEKQNVGKIQNHNMIFMYIIFNSKLEKEVKNTSLFNYYSINFSSQKIRTWKEVNYKKGSPVSWWTFSFLGENELPYDDASMYCWICLTKYIFVLFFVLFFFNESFRWIFVFIRMCIKSVCSRIELNHQLPEIKNKIITTGF